MKTGRSRSSAESFDRWRPALVNAGSAVAVGVLGWMLEGRLTAFVLLAVVIALGWGWWVSPLRRAQPHIDHGQALAQARSRQLIIYWRPGCMWCIKLWRDLEPDERDRLLWVNVMADPEASRYIRQFHDGDMTTPTVVTGNGRQVAASVEQVRARLARS